MARARKPIASDSPSATTPRTTGSRKSRCRAMGDEIGRQTCAIAPRGVRTATAQFEGPRIITPSRTACPPTVVTRELVPLEVMLPTGPEAARTLPRGALTAAGAPGALEPALEAPAAAPR